MNDLTPQPTDSREVLDETKRLKIIAIVSNGSSRRTAARYVGCSPSTITRTAARHPEVDERERL
jgi:IS30 family transposase